jgi:hypothetical protein
MGEQAAIHRESGFAGCALNPQPEGWGTSLFMIVMAVEEYIYLGDFKPATN